MNKEKLSVADVNQKSSIDILFTIDRRFVFGCGVLITSILLNNPNIVYSFKIYTLERDVKYVNNEINSRIKRLNLNNKFDIEIKAFESLSEFEALSKAFNLRQLICTLRLFILDAEYRNNEYDRLVMYMDVDMLCAGDMSELLKLKLDGFPFAACGDGNSMQVYGNHVKNYFNGGLLIFNIPEWRKLNLTEKCLNFLLKYKPQYADQDALNVVCDGNYYDLDRKFNLTGGGYNEITNNIVIYHFSGEKVWDPWYKKRFGSFASVYRKYAKKFEPNVCLWRTFKASKHGVLINYAYLEPRFSYKMLSRIMKRQGRLKGAVYFYVAHIVAKVKQKGLIGTILMKSNTRT